MKYSWFTFLSVSGVQQSDADIHIHIWFYIYTYLTLRIYLIYIRIPRYIKPFSDSFPLYVIIRCWISLPMVCRRFLYWEEDKSACIVPLCFTDSAFTCVGVLQIEDLWQPRIVRWWLAFFSNKVLLKYVPCFFRYAITYSIDYQYGVNITFFYALGNQKICVTLLRDFLYWNGLQQKAQ